MTTMKSRVGMRLAVLVTTASLIMTFAASAADDWRRASAPIDAVNPRARTVTIDDEVYEVPRDCPIRKESGGGEVSLSELRGGAPPGTLVPIDEIDFVRFEAIWTGSVWRMVEMTVLDHPTE
ncbi:MAG: hypothetical protein H6748_05690 [Spirochaetaceae bacterium]|nr:hypothetical protein [Spirochaetaceae bacterium]